MALRARFTPLSYSSWRRLNGLCRRSQPDNPPVVRSGIPRPRSVRLTSVGCALLSFSSALAARALCSASTAPWVVLFGAWCQCTRSAVLREQACDGINVYILLTVLSTFC
jgi:hypothetical protein